MSRNPKLRRLQKQRKYAVDQIRLRELNREAHLRAQGITAEIIQKVCKDVYGIIPDDITMQINDIRRRFLGIVGWPETTTREQILLHLNHLKDRTEVLYRVGAQTMYLIRETDGYYGGESDWHFFLFRVRGSYYKKSVRYRGRPQAMLHYNQETITWMNFFAENGVVS